MALTNDNGGMVMPVAPVGNGSGYGGDWGGSGLIWLLILFLFAFNGNGGYGYGGGNGGFAGADVQRGFDQQAVMTGINGVNTAVGALAGIVSNGFSQAEISANARQIANMQQIFGISQQLCDCCGENRLAVAQLGAQIAQENALTRSNTDAKSQMIMDKLCQLELDGVKQNYENRIAGMQQNFDTVITGLQNRINTLESQVTRQGFDASQNAQDAFVQNAINAAVARVNPQAVPAYIVQNPNCCGTSYNWNGSACACA